jgi:Flp pilus assembly protein CpaB
VRWYRLRRHPFGFWLITFLLAGLTYAAVGRAFDEAGTWGSAVSVVVVRRALVVGSEVLAGDVTVASVPRSLVPPGAATGLDRVVGRVALAALSPGEVVLRRRLAPEGLVGVAALVPPGLRAVALPVGEDGLRVAVGDAVDVLATFELDAPPPTPAAAGPPAAAGSPGADPPAADPPASADPTGADPPAGANSPAGTDPTVLVAAGAPVVEVRPGAVTVAVPPAAAARLAFALARATLTLALTTRVSTGTVPVETRGEGGGR